MLRLGTSFEVRHPRVITFEDHGPPGHPGRELEAGRVGSWDLPDAAGGAEGGRSGMRPRAARPRRWMACSVVEDSDGSRHRLPADRANHVPGPAGPDRTGRRRPGGWSSPRFLFVGKAEDKNGSHAARGVRTGGAAATRTKPRLDLVGTTPAWISRA
ncbi:hypothetical protein QJS66_01820 [Kocuria rhizophila]|nr:hypothetical protein QJS66_01820 [Kocuria rhizophila]